MNKIERKLSNLRLAVATLARYLSEYSGKDIERAGCRQAFEFCFEGFVGLFRAIATEQQQPGVLGTRDSFRFAFQAGLITSDTDWLALVPKRNDTVHGYNEKVAQAVFE